MHNSLISYSFVELSNKTQDPSKFQKTAKKFAVKVCQKYCMGQNYPEKTFVVYLKCEFSWASSMCYMWPPILSGGVNFKGLENFLFWESSLQKEKQEPLYQHRDNYYKYLRIYQNTHLIFHPPKSESILKK